MRWTFTSLAWVLIASAGIGCGGNREKTLVGDVIVLEADVGMIFDEGSGAAFVHKFEFTNPHPNTLNLTRSAKSCSCLGDVPEKVSIPAGHSCTIPLSGRLSETNRPTERVVKVDYKVDDSDIKQISLIAKATVVPLITTSAGPFPVDGSTGPTENEQIIGEVQFRQLKEIFPKAIEIRSNDLSIKDVEAKVEESNGILKRTIVFRGERPSLYYVSGHRAANIQIVTPDDKVYTRSLSWEVKRDVRCDHTSVFLRTDGTESSRVLCLRSDRLFRVISAVSSNPSIHAEVTTAESNSTCIRITVDGNAAATSQTEKLTIETDNPHQRRIVIPLYLFSNRSRV